METPSEMMDKMCTATFTRHADLSKEEFLKAINKENFMDEGQAVREAKMALIVGCTKELCVANRRLEILIENLKFLKGEKKNGENENC